MTMPKDQSIICVQWFFIFIVVRQLQTRLQNRPVDEMKLKAASKVIASHFLFFFSFILKLTHEAPYELSLIPKNIVSLRLYRELRSRTEYMKTPEAILI